MNGYGRYVLTLPRRTLELPVCRDCTISARIRIPFLAGRARVAMVGEDVAISPRTMEFGFQVFERVGGTTVYR